MFFNFVVLALILAITFYHSLFGLFSGVINVFCSVIAVAVAFGFYAPVNVLLTDQGLHPGYTEPAALVGLFVITLGALRTLADLFIRGNVKLPAQVDWIGGGLCGFLNAEIIVGMLVIGSMMLPFGGTLMGYSRFVRTDGGGQFAEFKRQGVWLAPDRFVAGLFAHLSNHSLAGQTRFDEVYPDFTRWIFWTGNTVQYESTPAPYRDKDGDGFKNGIHVQSWWRDADGVQAAYRRGAPDQGKTDYDDVAYRPPAGDVLLAVRAALPPDSADRAGRSPLHLFRPSMIRIVGDVGDTPRDYPARIIGGADPRLRGGMRIVDIDNNFSVPITGDAAELDIYFEVPESFEPRFIEYRRHARAALAQSAFAEAPPEELAPTMTAEEQEAARRVGREGFVGAVDRKKSGKEDQLPFPIDVNASGQNVESRDFWLVTGQFAGTESQLRGERAGARIERFAAPEGRTVLQVNFKPYLARSIVGRVFNFAGQTLNSYFAVDDKGEKHRLAGYYVTVKRGDERYVELFYVGGNPESPMAISYRGSIQLNDITWAELSNPASEAEIGLLFIVPPNTRVDSVENQTGAGVKGLRLRT